MNKNSEGSISRIAFLGLGLIGGSLARSLRASNYVGEIVGYSRSSETVDLALKLGVIDRGEISIADTVKDAEVVVLATPVQAIPKILANLATIIDPHTVVTDVGSVKRYVVDAMAEYMPKRRSCFVPAHPIAGNENSGVAASMQDLYRGKCVILTPGPETSVAAIGIVENMWRAAGANVCTMDADEHDNLLAIVSHLPHVVAYGMVDYVAQSENSETLFELAAAGFYDFTRIASSDPIMWRDICVTNPNAISDALKEYRNVLDRFIDAIESQDSESLQTWFTRAKQARDKALHKKNSYL